MVDYKTELYSIIESIINDQLKTSESDVDISPEVISAFTNLAFSHIKINSIDLECFAKHAKRMTINPEDVKLLARRNESLEKNISDFITRNIKKE